MNKLSFLIKRILRGAPPIPPSDVVLEESIKLSSDVYKILQSYASGEREPGTIGLCLLISDNVSASKETKQYLSLLLKWHRPIGVIFKECWPYYFPLLEYTLDWNPSRVVITNTLESIHPRVKLIQEISHYLTEFEKSINE